jgi:hypothetical protein
LSIYRKGGKVIFNNTITVLGEAKGANTVIHRKESREEYPHQYPEVKF